MSSALNSIAHAGFRTFADSTAEAVVVSAYARLGCASTLEDGAGSAVPSAGLETTASDTHHLSPRVAAEPSRALAPSRP